MTTEYVLLNKPLYAAVRSLYERVIKDFVADGQDLDSEAFLGSFPHQCVPDLRDDDDNEAIRSLEESEMAVKTRTALLGAGFSDDYKIRTVEALEAFYSDRSGEAAEDNFLDLIDDFLNYAIPRCAGLTDEQSRFDTLYSQFDQDLYSRTFKLTVQARLNNVSNHSGAFMGSAGFSVHYADRAFGSVNHPKLRDRVVPYFEIQKATHGALTNDAILLLLVFEENLPHNKNALNISWQRATEITRKFVLALRLVTGSGASVDYSGYRLLGRLSAQNMVFMPERAETIEDVQWIDVNKFAYRLTALLPPLLITPYEKVAVLDRKMEDAFLRHRGAATRASHSEQRVAIDSLLDYFQVLEALMPAEGSDRIALYVGLLLDGHRDDSGAEATRTYEFVKDMYKIRNEVMHGRVDNVLNGKFTPKFKNKLDIGRLQRIVRELAILYIANPQSGYNLNSLAEKLALRQNVPLTRI